MITIPPLKISAAFCYLLSGWNLSNFFSLFVMAGRKELALPPAELESAPIHHSPSYRIMDNMFNLQRDKQRDKHLGDILLYWQWTGSHLLVNHPPARFSSYLTRGTRQESSPSKHSPTLQTGVHSNTPLHYRQDSFKHRATLETAVHSNTSLETAVSREQMT